MKRRIAVLTMILAGAGIGSSVLPRVAAQAPARAPAAQEDVLPALLVEVRGLRTAMEQMASAGPRVQLALGRVQLQEQRVNNLVRRLDQSRAELLAAHATHQRLQQQSAGIEEGIRNLQPGGPSAEMMKDRSRRGTAQ